ncbi:hypothetical protein ACRJ4W_33650 [Streptomyces sp. GLT-R25]
MSSACPMPAAASTVTDTEVVTRMAQRGCLRRTGGRAGRCRCGRAGERGGVGKADTSASAGCGGP